MLWNDFSEKPVRSRVSVVAGVPQTGWEAPREFPNLSGAKVLAIDTESYDPELLDNGAGWARNRSHMVGASIATDDGHSWYFPIRHSVCPEQNMPVEPVIRFLKDVLETPNVAKVGANLLYDVGMLQHEGVHVKGALWDVQYAEALLVEQGRVNLDHLASKYLGKNKETSLLYQWSQQSYGGDINDQRANIHRCPPSLVGKYAEADASLPLEVFPHVWKELHKQGLHKLYRMECELIPLYVAMRYAGVRVDLEAAEILSHDLTQAYNTERFKLYDVAGFEVNVNSGDDLAKLFGSQGLHYPITETGKPSFVKDWLNQHEAPLAQQIVEVRKLLKLRDTFVDKIRNVNIDGKLYPQFHPLRGTGGGTRSGRYSCVVGSTPVHTARGMVAAKDVTTGDSVLSHTGVYRKVQRVWHKGKMPTVRLTLSNGATLHCATSHLLIRTDMTTITAGELHREYINSLDNKRGERKTSLTTILGWGAKDDNPDSRDDGDNTAQRSGSNKVTTEPRGTQTATQYAHSCDAVRGAQPNVREDEGSQQQLEGRMPERDGLQYRAVERETGAYPQGLDDEALGCYAATCECCSTPHRWEQTEQRSGQPSLDDIHGVQHYTQVTLSYSELAGDVHVYDYTIETDHTYLACGVFNHNCSGDMNAQQIPSRDSVWSKRIRGLFVPDIGHKYIRKYDYQAIEYRFLAHFAVGAGADELRKAYNDNPHIDYHNIVMDMVAPVAGWDVSTPELKAQRRKPLKTINFGIVFGMGEAKLSRSLGLSHTEGKDFLKQYHQSLPYAKATMKACGDFAESNGYIDTILGRRSRFEMFEPIDWVDQNDKTPLPWRSAIGKYGYGNVRLTGLHKALNRRLQGCKPASARIWTDKGLPTIGESVGKQLNVWTGFNWAKATVIPKGTWQMARVWLSTGEVIDCDTRHKFKLDNSDAWCAFEDLKLGDSVALPSLRQVVEWDGVVDVWYTLGYWLGDGWQGYSRSYDKRRDKWYTRESGRLVAADTKRDKLAEIFNYLKGERVNVHWTEKDRSGEGRKQLNWEINWSAQSACDYFKSIGVTHTNAHTKSIPECVWTANPQQQAAFLAGYLHADGSRKHAARGVVTVHSPNITLLREVQQLAHVLGNEATFSKPSPTGSLLTVGAPRAYPYKLMHADFKASGGAISYSNAGVNRGIVAKRAVTKCRDTWQSNAERVYREQKLCAVPYRFAYVTQIGITSEVAETYTLSVQDPRHQYIADGFVTKNSAADLLKKALHKCWTDGVFDSTGVPRLLIHDEILLSLPEVYDTEALNEMQHIFETALPLRVPILFEGEQGTNWGNTKALP